MRIIISYGEKRCSDMYSSRRYSRDCLLSSSLWHEDNNNHHPTLHTNYHYNQYHRHPYPLTSSQSTSSMLRSCSNFIHRFSSRLKIQNNPSTDLNNTSFDSIPETKEVNRIKSKSRERDAVNSNHPGVKSTTDGKQTSGVPPDLNSINRRLAAAAKVNSYSCFS